MSGLTLQQAREMYGMLDVAQQALIADAFAEAFKARLVVGMTPQELQDASDAAFVDAMKKIGGTA